MTSGLDVALVLLVVELQDLAVHVVVVLAEHRRAAVPDLRDALERVPDVRVRADVAAGQRADPLTRRDVRVVGEHLLGRTAAPR